MKTVKIWRHGHEGVLAGETENHSHVPPEYSPTFQWGKNISSEFDFMVMLPPTWFLFTLGVAALLPTHCAFVSSFFCTILCYSNMMTGLFLHSQE